MASNLLAGVGSAAALMEQWRNTRNLRIRAAVARGYSLREVGRAAGVDASTVKRIAERQR